jgi:hypothetical protein
MIIVETISFYKSTRNDHRSFLFILKLYHHSFKLSTINLHFPYISVTFIDNFVYLCYNDIRKRLMTFRHRHKGGAIDVRIYF